MYTPKLPCQIQNICSVSNSTKELKWYKKMLLQFRGARESQIFGGQQDLVPNIYLHNPIVLAIVNFLSLLCMLHSSLRSSNQLLYPNNKLGMNLTLNPYTNHNSNGVY